MRVDYLYCDTSKLDIENQKTIILKKKNIEVTKPQNTKLSQNIKRRKYQKL